MYKLAPDQALIVDVQIPLQFCIICFYCLSIRHYFKYTISILLEESDYYSSLSLSYADNTIIAFYGRHSFILGVKGGGITT